MTNKEFYEKYKDRKVLYKGKDIDAYVAGYAEEKYLILGFYSFDGCIIELNPSVVKFDENAYYSTYRFAKMKYVTIKEE